MAVFGVGADEVNSKPITIEVSCEPTTIQKKMTRKKLSLHKIAKLHKDLFKSRTPFGHETACALLVGVASTASIITDIIWVLGDMSIEARPYHYTVAFGLTSSAIVALASFLWLYRGANAYLIKKRRKHRRAAKKQFLQAHTPTHCDVNPKKQINKAYLKLVPDLSEE